MKIGIDPDVDKSGVAVIENGEIELFSLSFWQLFEFLKERKPDLVRVEGGWLNKMSNFRAGKPTAALARIGKNVGSNHEAGRKIVEMCEYLQIKHEVVKPLQKHWKGTDGKITHEEVVKYFKIKQKRTNQEERDALLLLI